MITTDDRIITNEIYKPLDFFMIRTPLLPINSYINIFNSNLNDEDIINKLIQFSNNPIIREAIAVGSVDLLLSLSKLDASTNGKEKEKIFSSLLKYFIRMTTRTTPFGEFSGVTLGKFTDKTNVILDDISKYKKRARPDMEWMYKLINKLEKNKCILDNLVVTWNSVATFVGSRVEMPYLSVYAQECNESIDEGDIVSIRATSVVRYIAQVTNCGVKYRDLMGLMIKQYKDVSEETIDILLKQLLEKEILITDLRPPLDIISPYEYIINKVKDIKSAKDCLYDLEKVNEMIKQYNMLPIGEGEEKYLNIIKLMKSIVKSKKYLQVDLRLSGDNIELNKCVATELTKAAETLCKLSSVNNDSKNIIEYTTEFIGKYGEDREIPLLEVVDSDKGIGFPAGYTMPIVNKRLHDNVEKPDYEKLKDLIIFKVIESINNKQHSIEINSNDIKDIKIQESVFKDMPASFEINAFIKAKSKDDIDDGNYELFIGPNIGSDKAGKTFGRFTDILDDKIYSELNKINSTEKEIVGSNTVFAQLIFVPSKGTLGNICLTSNIRDYEIIISTTSSVEKSKVISIQDLVLGIDNKRLYIKCPSLNKKVIVTTNNMLNRSIMPNICRFLLDISEDKKSRWFPMDLLSGYISKLPYVPSIKIGKVIVLPQTWKLNEDILDLNLKNIKKEEFFEAIEIWRKKWDVPKFIYQVESDNRLMFNLNNKIHLNELLSILKKKRNIKITDVECDFNNYFVNSERGKYVSEIVLPIVKNNIKLSNKRFINDNFKRRNSKLSTLDSRRTIFPSGDWMFLKLYGNHIREEELIAFEINSICKELLNEGLIDEFFFMRYVDLGNHIRLRFKGTPKVLYTKVLSKLSKWFDTLRDEGLLSKVEIDTYEREIERYGGLELMEYAEKVFFYDSIVVSNILYLRRMRQLNMSLDEVALCSFIMYLEDFNIPYLDQIKLLDIITDQSQYRKEFIKRRTKYMLIGNSNNDFKNLRNTEEGQLVYNILKTRSKAIKEYAIKLNEFNTNNRLTNTLENIYLSVLHLHCNRLFGTDREKEKEVVSYTRHTLYALKYFKVKRES